jgi:hypothetical protein
VSNSGVQGTNASVRIVDTQTVTVRVTFTEAIILDVGYQTKLAGEARGTAFESPNYFAISGLGAQPMDRTEYPPVQERQLTMIVIPERSFDITVKLQYYVTYFRVSRFASNPSALQDSNELIFYYKPRASSLQIEYTAS